MTPQDKINYQRKATYDQHLQSNDFGFMDGSQDCEDAYTLGFVTGCMWLTSEEIEKMKERMSGSEQELETKGEQYNNFVNDTFFN